MSQVEFETSTDVIHKICGILETNSLDVQVAGMELTGIYPIVSMLEHDCLSNVNLIFDEFGHICVYAARKIVK